MRKCACVCVYKINGFTNCLSWNSSPERPIYNILPKFIQSLKSKYIHNFTIQVKKNHFLVRTQMRIKRRVDKQHVVQPHIGILLGHEDEASSDTGHHVDGPWKHDSQQEKQTQKANWVCSIYVMCPDNPQTQKVGHQLTRAGGEGWGVTASRDTGPVF